MVTFRRRSDSKQITTDHRFPVSDLSQQNRFDNFDADQSHPTLNMTMRLKKSESFDDFGHNELHPQLYKNNNDSKLIEFDEIMERNEDCDPIVSTTHTYPTDDIIDNDIDDDDDSEVHRCDESHFGMMRRFGGIKSVGAIRRQWHRPVAEVFPNNTHTRTVNKNTGLRSIASSELTKHISNNSSFTDERFPTSPPSLTHLLIDADSTHRISISESSPSSSSDHPQQQSMLRKSCPDLRIADSNGILSKNMEICRAQNRIRRAHEKKQAALWKKKPIAEWSLDDVLLWLQHLKLDDVASIMIGYDISGRDVERWDNNILEQLGVSTEETRNKILHELRALKLRQTNSSAELNETNGTKSKRGKPMIPLFKLVRSTSYDKVVALETPLTTRDITVAEGRFGCLQVTKVNGANIPLREQDCFLEINELPGQAFRSPLMFTKLVTEAAGEPIRLVVLRRRLLPTTDGVAGCDYDNDTSGRGTFLEKTIQAVDQESSASSGVSSSELSSEVVLLNDDNKSQILRL
ncbi:SAM domain (Sterile alpha motif) family protein [Acanthocheilonema viteae]